ncbi:MAG: hypothetical protein HGA96_07100 [Desulfobulbaceae bacterium]|nr:hypothetical protein [Desulfobulbaceae bacterium]
MKLGNLGVLAAVSGVLLLAPVVAMGHNAVGPCADCHVMHNSQNGAAVNTSGPQNNLLRFNCIGCHAFGTNDPATGRSATFILAPQVGPLVGTAGAQDSGGYFSAGGVGEYGRTHNVADLFLPATGADTLIVGTTAPGGTFALNDGFGAPLLRCESCHDRTIGHAPADSVRAGDATSSYRMLHRPGAPGLYVSGTGDKNFEVGAATEKNIYNAISMNRFCADCHGTFHGWSGNSWAGTDSNGNGVGPWIRHPTDITTNSYGANYNGGDKVVPVGDAGGTNQVMCISCHRPHGNANADMLRFGYGGSENVAGGATASVGCETCHGAM